MAYNKGLHGGNHRTRPYGFMLILVFVAAMLGVMMLHKLRERRVYNLLVKEKDRELHALQLLLQKERDRSKEIEGKNEEMKAKIYTLRGQKMELDNRVLKMKSTMDSLKEEQRVLESAFEEKQNEIRMLQGQGKSLGNEDGNQSVLNKFKDGEVTVEAEDEIKNIRGNDGRLIKTYEHGKGHENWQAKGVSVGKTAGGKTTDAEEGKKNEDSQDDSDLGVTGKR